SHGGGASSHDGGSGVLATAASTRRAGCVCAVVCVRAAVATGSAVSPSSQTGFSSGGGVVSASSVTTAFRICVTYLQMICGSPRETSSLPPTSTMLPSTISSSNCFHVRGNSTASILP